MMINLPVYEPSLNQNIKHIFAACTFIAGWYCSIYLISTGLILNLQLTCSETPND